MRKIVQIGHPVLRKKARTLSFKGLKTGIYLRLFSELERTLRGIRKVRPWPKVNGLAAPQIGVSRRAIVVCRNGAYLRLANPQITSRSRRKSQVWDGCFSFLYLRGRVSRNRTIVVTGRDDAGRKVKIMASDLFSYALQHEIDHLNGILYIDRIKDPRSLKSIENCYWDQTRLRQTRKVIGLIT